MSRRNPGGSPWGGAPRPSHAKSARVSSQEVVFPAPPLSAATSSPHLRCLWLRRFPLASVWPMVVLLEQLLAGPPPPPTHSCPCRASSRPGRSSAAQRAHNHCRMPHRSSLLPPSPLTVCDVTLLQRSGLRLQWRALDRVGRISVVLIEKVMLLELIRCTSALPSCAWAIMCMTSLAYLIAP